MTTKNIDRDRLEDLLAAHDPAYLRSIAEARAEHQRGDTFTLDQVFPGQSSLTEIQRLAPDKFRALGIKTIDQAEEYLG